MNNKEHIKKDLVVAFDFVGQIIENPELLNEIPDGTEIKFLDDVKPKTEKPKKSSSKKYVKVKRQFEIL
jgi:hypothetical protein